MKHGLIWRENQVVLRVTNFERTEWSRVQMSRSCGGRILYLRIWQYVTSTLWRCQLGFHQDRNPLNISYRGFELGELVTNLSEELGKQQEAHDVTWELLLSLGLEAHTWWRHCYCPIVTQTPHCEEGIPPATFTHSRLPLLEHKAEKWRLPPTSQSQTDASYLQSLTNTSRQRGLGNVVSRLPAPCATQRRLWENRKRLSSNNRYLGEGTKAVVLDIACCYFSFIKMMVCSMCCFIRDITRCLS